MEPLELTPTELARALEVLGLNLERWRIALREEFRDGGRDEDAYDSYVHAPILSGGHIHVDRTHLGRLLAALDELEAQVRGQRPDRDIAALVPVRKALMGHARDAVRSQG